MSGQRTGTSAQPAAVHFCRMASRTLLSLTKSVQLGQGESETGTSCAHCPLLARPFVSSFGARRRSASPSGELSVRVVAQPAARAGASGPSQARALQRRSDRRSSNAATMARRPRRPAVTSTSTRRPARSTAMTRPRICSPVIGRSFSNDASPHSVSWSLPPTPLLMERTRCATEREPVWQKTTSATSISAAAAGATIRTSPSSIVCVMLRPPARKRTLIPSANNPSTTAANVPRWRSGPPRLDFTDQNIGISAEN
jgi:hypothetical protein